MPQIKFETHSARVKGVTFHDIYPWLAASLHSGKIQLWDYEKGKLLVTFDRDPREKPFLYKGVPLKHAVRSVDFHPTLPLLVSGCDATLIEVWELDTSRVDDAPRRLFSLEGHTDYVRTVQFHPHPDRFPWILSASDDMTLRLWDYQQRSCLGILRAHAHYVMCAAFHPTQHLIVSASLDGTVRVWDTTRLCEKHAAGLSVRDITHNVEEKFVLEGHGLGVNWADFVHSATSQDTLHLISASDDGSAKLWRLNETVASKVVTFQGHGHFVTCCLALNDGFPSQPNLLTASEDGSIGFWNWKTGANVAIFMKDDTRFWTLARKNNLVAAGSDLGMVVFSLDENQLLGTSFAYANEKSPPPTQELVEAHFWGIDTLVRSGRVTKVIEQRMAHRCPEQRYPPMARHLRQQRSCNLAVARVWARNCCISCVTDFARGFYIFGFFVSCLWFLSFCLRFLGVAMTIFAAFCLFHCFLIFRIRSFLQWVRHDESASMTTSSPLNLELV